MPAPPSTQWIKHGERLQRMTLTAAIMQSSTVFVCATHAAALATEGAQADVRERAAAAYLLLTMTCIT